MRSCNLLWTELPTVPHSDSASFKEAMWEQSVVEMICNYPIHTCVWYSQSAVESDCAGEGSGDPVNEGFGFRSL